jgi:hypothetical protein
METGISIWDADGGDYFAYSASGVGDTEARYLQVGQGFFVLANAASVSLSFDNSMRTHNSTSVIDKKEGRLVNSHENSLQIKVSKGDKKDFTYVSFKNDAIWDYHIKTDVHKLFGLASTPQIFSYIRNDQGDQMAIKSIPFPQNKDTLHLGFRVDIPETYNIEVLGLESFNENQMIYLLDRVNEQVYDLRQTSNILFSYHNSDPEHRFDLIFDKVSSTEDDSEINSPINIYSSNNRIFVQTNDNNDYSIRVLNMLGQQVFEANNIISFKDGQALNLPSSIYLIEVFSEEFSKVERVYIK